MSVFTCASVRLRTLRSVAAEYGCPLATPSWACVPADAAAFPIVCVIRAAVIPAQRRRSDAAGCNPNFRIADTCGHDAGPATLQEPSRPELTAHPAEHLRTTV